MNMDMERFRAFVGEIGAELGDGWSAAPHATWGGCVRLSHHDGRALAVWRLDDGARVSVEGDFPTSGYHFKENERPETGAATSRGARAVARQIERRVMPVYAETLAKVHAHNAEAERSAAEEKRVHDLLVSYVPEGVTWRPSIQHTDGRTYSRKTREWTDTGEVLTSIEFLHLDEKTAHLIMQAYAAGMGHTPAPAGDATA